MECQMPGWLLLDSLRHSGKGRKRAVNNYWFPVSGRGSLPSAGVIPEPHREIRCLAGKFERPQIFGEELSTKNYNFKRAEFPVSPSDRKLWAGQPGLERIVVN